jgi:hypothetical protein
MMNDIAELARQDRSQGSDYFELVFIALLVVGRIGLLLASPIGLSGDAFGYVAAAEHILTEGELPQLRVQPHGFPLLIAPLLAVSDADISQTLLRVHTLMDAAVVLVLLRLARRLLEGPGLRFVRVIACVMIAIQPFSATMVASVYAETSSQFLMFFGVWMLSRHALSARSRAIALVGPLALGLAAMLRSELIVLNFTILAVFIILVIKEYGTIFAVARKALLALALYSVIPISMVTYQYTSTGELGLVKPSFHNAGYMAWMRTWFAIEKTEHDRFAFGPGGTGWPGFDVTSYPSRAFDSQEEQDRIAEAMSRWQSSGYTDAVDRELHQLATEKSRQNLLRHHILIPSARMIHYWINIDGAQTVLRVIPIGRPFSTVVVGFFLLMKLIFVAFALVGFFAIWFRPTRLGADESLLFFARLAGSAVVLRTLELGVLSAVVWAGLMEVRYVAIVYPFLLILFLFGLRYSFELLNRSCPMPDPGVRDSRGGA